MCLGGGRDTGGDAARAAEERRRADIETGRRDIDRIFARFDEPYFQTAEKAALDRYMPDAERQIQGANRQTIFGLSRRGNLNSTGGLEALGDVAEAGDRARLEVASRARGFAQEQRNDIATQRANLIQQLAATADPASAASAANALAAARTRPQPYDTLGNVVNLGGSTIALNEALRREGYPGLGVSIFGGRAR